LRRATKSEYVGRGEALEELAALLGLRLVENHGGDLADVGVYCESEEKKLQHGNEQSEKESSRIAQNVQRLFAADRGEAVKEVFHWPLSMMR